MKTPAMINESGKGVYILAERPWATESGVITQCLVAAANSKYAKLGIGTGWVEESKLTRL